MGCCRTCRYGPKLRPDEVRTRGSHHAEEEYVFEDTGLCKYPLPFFAENYVKGSDGVECRVYKRRGGNGGKLA